MYDDSFLCLQIARSDIRPHVKWAVSLVIADDKYSSSGICMCRSYVTTWVVRRWTNNMYSKVPMGYNLPIMNVGLFDFILAHIPNYINNVCRPTC